MDDIRRVDKRLFTEELLRASRLTWALPLAFFGAWIYTHIAWLGLALLGMVTAGYISGAYNAGVARRWNNNRFKALWHACEDRLKRFDDVLGKMRRDHIADLQEMPKTIHTVGDSLYAALRRSDIITHDVFETEKGILQSPPAWEGMSGDPQARELYRIADKNIAEYRQIYGGVMGGVQRAEAQAAVYMTTLDSLRMKMLGYRLVGRQPDMSSHDFLDSLAEARVQLQAIDQALDELDFSNFPKTISVMPPIPQPSEAETIELRDV
ncbi:MAG: hypothetical protein ABL949_04155 [Fimbriimonadaceae bacterium]